MSDAPISESVSAALAARYYDGRTSHAHNVILKLDQHRGILLIPAENQPDGECVLAEWPFKGLRLPTEAVDEERPVTLHHREHGEAELVIAPSPHRGAWLEAVEAHTEHRQGRMHFKLPRTKYIVLASALLMPLLLFVVLPALVHGVAGLIPRSVERQIGESVHGQVLEMYGTALSGTQVKAALQSFARPLATAMEMEEMPEVQLLPSGEMNALALPGGKVVLLCGLVQKVPTAEALAGVIGHEFSHVKHRDSMHRLVESIGVAGMLSMLGGDAETLSKLANLLIMSGHSRKNESRSDRDGAEALRKLGAETESLAAFLGTLDGSLEKSALGNHLEKLEIISSHPLARKRAEELRQLQQRYAPSNNGLLQMQAHPRAAEWKKGLEQLQTACIASKPLKKQ
jgi:Zn-dependent protease with chaperone function